jgi:hypothetical protein
MRVLTTFVFVLLTALSSAVAAQTIYRCGTSYSQVPCADAKELHIDDSRAPEQKQQADANTQQQQKLAEAMEKERLAKEQLSAPKDKSAHPSKHAASSPDTETQAASSSSKNAPKPLSGIKFKPDGFVAKVPGSEKKAAAKQSGSSEVPSPSKKSTTP